MNKKTLIVVIALAVVGIGWYLFRPELLFVKTAVNEALPTSASGSAAAGPQTLASGMFHSGAHETKGTATIFQLPDGKRVLRLTQFETSNGPNVHVYLGVAPDATDNATVTQAGFLDLGSLKGTTGDQNYEIPAEADLGRYRSVTIWCARFNVNFGTAPLTMQPTAPELFSQGNFHSVAHETRGAANIFQLPDGRQILRLTEFETSNGPNVHVYLGVAPDATDNATVTQAGYLDLGSLKGTTGDQNYEIPAGTDLAKYQSVTIWCARFNVNFGTAPLARL